jgi:hypothetical protein
VVLVPIVTPNRLLVGTSRCDVRGRRSAPSLPWFMGSKREGFIRRILSINLNALRIAPSPQPSPPMGAREKTSQFMRFMGLKREGFIREILSMSLMLVGTSRGS